MEKQDFISDLVKRNRPEADQDQLAEEQDEHGMVLEPKTQQKDIQHNDSDKERPTIDSTQQGQSLKPNLLKKKNKIIKKCQQTAPAKVDMIITENFDNDNAVTYEAGDQFLKKIFEESALQSSKMLKICKLDFFGDLSIYNSRHKMIEYQIKDKQAEKTIGIFQESLKVADKNSLMRFTFATNLFKRILGNSATTIEKEAVLNFVDNKQISQILQFFEISQFSKSEDLLVPILVFINELLESCDNKLYDDMFIYYQPTLALLKQILNKDFEYKPILLLIIQSQIKVLENLTIKNCDSYFVEKDEEIIEICSLYYNYLSKNQPCLSQQNSQVDRPNYVSAVQPSCVAYINSAFRLQDKNWIQLNRNFKKLLLSQSNLDCALNNYASDEIFIKNYCLFQKAFSNSDNQLKQNIFESVVNWLEKNGEVYCLLDCFKDIINLIENIFPYANLSQSELTKFDTINTNIQNSFSIVDAKNFVDRILPYFTFLIVYVYPAKKNMIIKNFLDPSFKKNQLNLFKLDYQKIRYLGQDFFKALKQELDQISDVEIKKKFIIESQIMEIIDLIMIVGLDPFSNHFIHSLKVSLVGPTIDNDKSVLGISDVDLIVFDSNPAISKIFIGEETFRNDYENIYENFEYSKTAFLGPNEKIIGIAQNWDEKPFFFASIRVITKNKAKNWLDKVDKKVLKAKFLRDQANLLNLHMGLVGLPSGRKTQLNLEMLKYMKTILTRLPLRTMLYQSLWNSQGMSIAIYDLKSIKLIAYRNISKHIIHILNEGKEKIISCQIADDERHCCILTEHSQLIIDFLANKLKASYQNRVRMSLMSFSKDLSQIVITYGALDYDFLLLEWDRKSQDLIEISIRRLVNSKSHFRYKKIRH